MEGHMLKVLRSLIPIDFSDIWAPKYNLSHVPAYLPNCLARSYLPDMYHDQLNQGWAKFGPQAESSPSGTFIRPAASCQ